MPAIHSHTQALLTLIRESGSPPFEALSLVEVRRIHAGSHPVLRPPPDDVAQVWDLKAPGKAGDIPLRPYRGTGTSAGQVLGATAGIMTFIAAAPHDAGRTTA